MVRDDPELTLRLARVLAPVTVLGPGSRIALWVQGCGLACPSCASVDTWDPAGGAVLPVAQAADLVVEQVRDLGLDGITISGGEPTDQGTALTGLLDQVRRALAPVDLDVLVFTGRTLSAAQAVAPTLVAAADCVVSGPYRADRPAAGRLLASDNQRLSFCTPDVERRYRGWLTAPGPDLQVAADDRDLYLVGLPAAGDLDRFATGLQDRGVTLGAVSWRA
jgi:anaerobic ribonucleoside-triphosphate reductase activating protein